MCKSWGQEAGVFWEQEVRAAGGQSLRSPQRTQPADGDPSPRGRGLLQGR